MQKADRKCKRPFGTAPAGALPAVPSTTWRGAVRAGQAASEGRGVGPSGRGGRRDANGMATRRGGSRTSTARTSLMRPGAPPWREYTVRLTSHGCPLSHAQETVTSSCHMRRPLWTQLSLSCSREGSWGESMEKARRMSACAPKTPHGAALLDASPPDPTGTQPTGPILSRNAGEDGACNQPDEGQPPNTPWVST